jgi:hypothetical protein
MNGCFMSSMRKMPKTSASHWWALTMTTGTAGLDRRQHVDSVTRHKTSTAPDVGPPVEPIRAGYGLEGS